MTTARIVALAVAASTASPAAAQPPYPPYPPPEAAEPFAPPALSLRRAVPRPSRKVKRWYGWQIITADAMGATLVIGGIAGESEGAVAAGALGYLFVTPLVHFAHHEGGQAGISLLLFRPIIALATLGLAEGNCDGGCNEESGRFSATILAGWATATLLDAAMAYETVWVAPLVTPDGGRGLALTGAF